MNRATPVYLLVAAGIALTGCGSPAPVAGSPTTTAPASPSPSPAVPTEAQLKAGLLTESEIGAPFTAETPSAETTTSSMQGCDGLANLDSDTSHTPGRVSATAEFSAGDDAFVEQQLVAGPLPSFEHAVRSAKESLPSCTHLAITDGQDTLEFSMTPIDFGRDATAARLDGSVAVLHLTGYVAIRAISRNVAMLFYYFDFATGSSQSADHIFTLAVDKATRALPSS